MKVTVAATVKVKLMVTTVVMVLTMVMHCKTYRGAVANKDSSSGGIPDVP